MRRFPEEEYHIPFFDEIGYVRRLCPSCKEYFWTQDLSQETCGEANPDGCASYTFIGRPPTRKPYSLREMREAFLSFFEGRGHKRIKPYPVVARWRDDLYFTHASIIDFQPYVTNGVIPPPANPLVIAQPCIRFVDIDNVGLTFGRHLTIFEMGGHHAFNYPDQEIYWKDETVRYHHEFVTNILGIPSEEVIYKEGVWSGGGNAGPDLEGIVRGLEISTLVFMKFKVVDDEFIELPIRTVDTGYGIERYTWLSQGGVSCFHAVYGSVLKGIFDMAGVEPDEGLLTDVAKFSGLIDVEKVVDRMAARKRVAKFVGLSAEGLDKALTPVENAFAVADHTKCLAFVLAEGVVPSNVREGYLARLLLRRTYRLLKALGIERKLLDVVSLQIGHWSFDFPHLSKARDEVLEVLSTERDKYEDTLRRGASLVRREAQKLRAKGESKILTEALIQLYDSHGLPPELVRDVAKEEGITVDVPESFYAIVAKRHVQAPPLAVDEEAKALEEKVKGLPETKAIYYEDPYAKAFEAKVLKVAEGRYVVLDATAFYPEGGGQPADVGRLSFGGRTCEVVDVKKVGKVVVHLVKGELPSEGTVVKGEIDWDRRYALMKAHTATHILISAARRALGEHVWQSGAQKDVERSRLDISHHRRASLKEVHEIEKLANAVIAQDVSIEARWMPREVAEHMYGFRLYQGGVVPGRDIRVVKVGDWDVEACGGTHVKNAGEIGFIKVVGTERIQDGVERLDFSVGMEALKFVQRNEEILRELAEVLNAPLERLPKAAKRFLDSYKEIRRREERLLKEIALKEAAFIKETVEAKKIGNVRFLKKKFDEVDVERMIKIASELVKSDPHLVTLFYAVDEAIGRVVIMAGEAAVNLNVNASELAKVAASSLGGGGSGRPDFAQGGGTKPEMIEEALTKAEEALKKQVRAF